MGTLAEKTNKDKNQAHADSPSRKQTKSESIFQLVDNRTETAENRNLQRLANSSPLPNPATQLNSTADSNSAPQQPVQLKENNTGLPDQLKSGVESLSGQSMDDVKVHSNSDKPAELNAHAYAQGTDIHLGPGQEKHLPHEAWHVAQQKQGRVKPTAQLKGKVNINDDPGLENEADVMGAKAMQFGGGATEVLIQNQLQNSATQLKDGPDSLKDFDMVEDLNEFDQMEDDKIGDSTERPDVSFIEKPEELESFVIPEGYDVHGDLDTVIEQDGMDKDEASASPMKEKDLLGLDGDLGGDRKIDIMGELSTKAKLKGFFMKESTYSLFTKKAEEFNGTVDVVKKQSLLKELKPLARSWIKEHEKEALTAFEKSGDDAGMKKLATMNRFLHSTTTNFPDTIKSFQEALTHIQAFRSNPYSNRHSFQKAHEQYLLANKKFDHYKNTYPPAVNLLYASEIANIKAAISNLNPIKQDDLSGSGFDTGLGFEVKDTTAAYNIETGLLSISGKPKLNLKDIAHVDGGTVTASFDGKGNFKEITLVGAECKVSVLDQEVSISGIGYTMSKNTFTATSAKADLDVLNTKFSVEVQGIEITKEKGVDYSLIKGSSGETFDTGVGILIKNPEFVSIKDFRTYISGGLKLSVLDDSVQAEGTAGITLDNKNEVKNIQIDDGNANATILGQKISVNGFGYDYSSSAFTAEDVTGNFEILDTKFNVTAQDVSITKEGGFNYSLLEGESPDTIDTHLGVLVIKPGFVHAKGERTYVYGGLDINIPNVGNASGEAAIALDSKLKPESIEAEGDAEINVAGQKIQATGIKLDSKEETFSADEAKGTLEFFGKSFVITAENPSFSKEKGFDFDKLDGELPPMDFGIVKSTKTTLSYSKKDQEYKATTDYQMADLSALGFSDITSDGKVQITYSESKGLSGKASGNLFFNIAGQKAEFKEFDLDSEKKTLSAKTASLDLSFAGFSRKFIGTNVSLSAAGFAFDQLSMDAAGEEFDLSILTIKPTKYAIINLGSGAYALKADGGVHMNLPSFLGVTSTGSIEGNVSYNFKDKSLLGYNITKGNAALEAENPLKKITDLLGIGGDGGSKVSFDLGGSVMVFPGVSATFGVNIQFGLDLGPFGVQISVDESTNKLKFDMYMKETGMSAGIYAYVGVKAGHELILSLEVRLRAGGSISLLGKVGYVKEYPVNTNPSEESGLSKDSTGLYYNLDGTVKLEAFLDVIATALYFFQKSFPIELGSKELGKVSFSDKDDNKKGLEVKKADLADKSQLEEGVDPDKLDEYKEANLKVADLLNYDHTKRFGSEEKQQVLDSFKSVETKRKSEEDYPMTNLFVFNDFVSQRCNWPNLFGVLEANKSFDAQKTSDADTAKVLSAIKELSRSIHLAQAFVDHFGHKMDRFKSHYEDPLKTPFMVEFLQALENKKALLQLLNSFKQEYLHSTYWGDERFQAENVNTDDRLWGLRDSKYKAFIDAYKIFSQEVLKHKAVNEKIAKDKAVVEAFLRGKVKGKAS
jgi:hypothetical protein